MTKLEWFTKNGLDGVRMGFIQVDFMVKYQAIITYFEILESLQGKVFNRKQTRHSVAVVLTAQRLNVDRTSVYKYLDAFDNIEDPGGILHVDRNDTRWILVNSSKNT